MVNILAINTLPFFVVTYSYTALPSTSLFKYSRHFQTSSTRCHQHSVLYNSNPNVKLWRRLQIVYKHLGINPIEFRQKFCLGNLGCFRFIQVHQQLQLARVLSEIKLRKCFQCLCVCLFLWVSSPHSFKNFLDFTYTRVHTCLCLLSHFPISSFLMAFQGICATDSYGEFR